MYALSLALSVLTVFTAWMMITVFILPPLAFYYGYKAYQARRRKPGPFGITAKLVAVLPMAFSVAIFVLVMLAINTGYKA
jgi:hypothetical protein